MNANFTQTQWGQDDGEKNIHTGPFKYLTSFFKDTCEKRNRHMLNPCTDVNMKHVWVDRTEVKRTVSLAVQRVEYETDTWLKPVRVDESPSANMTVMSSLSSKNTSLATKVMKGNETAVDSLNRSQSIPVNASELTPSFVHRMNGSMDGWSGRGLYQWEGVYYFKNSCIYCTYSYT